MTRLRGRWIAVIAFAALGAAFLGGVLLGRSASEDPDQTAVVDTTNTTMDPTTSTERVRPDDEHGATLAAVIDRGHVNCGVNTGLRGFAEERDYGGYFGFDVDFCRAVAAAVLGDADAVEFYPLTATERWDALLDGTIDVLFRNTTWVQHWDANALDFGPTVFHDGQQVLGRSSDFTTSSTLADLDGAVVCVNEGTTSEANIREQAAQVGAEVEFLLTRTFDEGRDRFAMGECDAVTTDGSALFVAKVSGEPDPGSWVIFPTKPFSREPLGPVYRANDSEWADIVAWTIFATIIADEKGITSTNVDGMVAVPPDAEALRLLGGEGEQQTAMGLDAEAFYWVIKWVGSYGEIFERNLGPIGISREGTLNAGVDGFGLITAPPAR